MQGYYVVIYTFPPIAISAVPTVVKNTPDSYNAYDRLSQNPDLQPANSNKPKRTKKLFRTTARALTSVRNFAATLSAAYVVNQIAASQLWNMASAAVAHSIAAAAGGFAGLAGAGLAALAARTAMNVFDFGAREAMANAIKTIEQKTASLFAGKLSGFKKAQEEISTPAQTAEVIPFRNSQAAKKPLMEKRAA